VILGRGNELASLALDQGWIGTGWLETLDLTGKFTSDARDFNRRYLESVIETNQISSRIGAGLACGMTWTVGFGLESGDRVITRDSEEKFHVGELTGPYQFHKGEELPHRRPVAWYPGTFSVDVISEELRRSLSTRNTVADLSSHHVEIEALLKHESDEISLSAAAVREDSLSFALERQLEEFIVANWEQTTLGRNYEIFKLNDETVGQQFATDTGPIDILAQSKDGKELLIIELKRGRAGDNSVGQVLRYMSYIKELDQTKSVRGIIIGTEEHPGLRRALSMVPEVTFFRYKMNFELVESPAKDV
jgi:restriction system protein